ncbi:MAG: hypothetical protein WDN28_00530 [Chthoniobacter sp.]
MGGRNGIRGNRVENNDHARQKSAVGYNIDALPEFTTEFRNNTGLNCAKYLVAPRIVSTDNDLR